MAKCDLTTEDMDIIHNALLDKSSMLLRDLEYLNDKIKETGDSTPDDMKAGRKYTVKAIDEIKVTGKRIAMCIADDRFIKERYG